MKKVLFFAIITSITAMSCKKDVSDIKKSNVTISFVAAIPKRESAGNLAHFVIKMKAEAVGTDFYFTRTATYGSHTAGTTSIAYVIENQTGVVAAGSTASYAVVAENNQQDASGRYYLPEGNSMMLQFDVFLISPGPGSYRLRVPMIQAFTAEGHTVKVQLDDDKYCTDFLVLQ